MPHKKMPQRRLVKCARAGCRKRFVQKNKLKRYCSPACKTRAWMDKNLGYSQVAALRTKIRELEQELQELKNEA